VTAKVLSALLLFASFSYAQVPGKTWALVVGVSKFQKLPSELWLQYPEIDAKTFAAFVQSPRGGSVPNDQLLVITNEQATIANLRNAFKTFLTKPGKDDTVFILFASHGLADNRGAYILTYDSDAQNLADTALPMSELHSLVEDELTRAGHVIFLADVCHASAIAGQKTDSISGAVAELGESPGEMLGLMAARPKEVSFEGPEFGGGHGAFTWSVLRGLSGEADTDKKGFVTAGELIDFVTNDVSKLTKNKQHPRDFGNMENSTKLSDLSKPGIQLPK
jgi:uncharacterized caspase-like protein